MANSRSALDRRARRVRRFWFDLARDAFVAGQIWTGPRAQASVRFI